MNYQTMTYKELTATVKSLKSQGKVKVGRVGRSRSEMETAIEDYLANERWEAGLRETRTFIQKPNYAGEVTLLYIENNETLYGVEFETELEILKRRLESEGLSYGSVVPVTHLGKHRKTTSALLYK